MKNYLIDSECLGRQPSAKFLSANFLSANFLPRNHTPNVPQNLIALLVLLISVQIAGCDRSSSPSSSDGGGNTGVEQADQQSDSEVTFFPPATTPASGGVAVPQVSGAPPAGGAPGVNISGVISGNALSIGAGTAGITPTGTLLAAEATGNQGPLDETDGVANGVPVLPVFGSASRTIGGLQSAALAAVGGPLLNSPRAIMHTVDDYALNDSGQFAYTGGYELDDEQFNGLWFGTPAGVALQLRTGVQIPAAPSGQFYLRSLELSLADDGSIGQLIQSAGPSSEYYYLVSRDQQHQLVMSTGTILSGLDGSVNINSIDFTDRNSQAVALVTSQRTASAQVSDVATDSSSESADQAGSVADADPSTSESDGTDDVGDDVDVGDALPDNELRRYSLWLSTGTSVKAVVHSTHTNSATAPRLANGCSFFAPSNGFDNNRMGLSSQGVLIFQALVGADNSCPEARAVLTYDGKVYRELLKDGDLVPGDTSFEFSDVSLYGVMPDGTAIVFSNLVRRNDELGAESEPESDGETDPLAEEPVSLSRWSFWQFPPQGGSNLIVLEGEEIQQGGIVTAVSSELTDVTLRWAENNRFSISLLLDNAQHLAYFSGIGHSGQPHASIADPGVAALSFVFTELSVLDGLPQSAYLRRFGPPTPDFYGGLLFYAEVDGLELPDEPFNALWRVDADGVIERVVQSGDKLNIGGLEKPIGSLSVPGKINRPESAGLRVNSAGMLLIRATVDTRFGDPVLLYLSAE